MKEVIIAQADTAMVREVFGRIESVSIKLGKPVTLVELILRGLLAVEEDAEYLESQGELRPPKGVHNATV